MTNENKLICFYEDIGVKRNKKTYVVTLELEEYTFYINSSEVENISEKNGADENLIAIILAYIEYARKCRNADGNKRAPKIDERIIASAITELLVKYSEEEVIYFFKDLKWHELFEILNSNTPIRTIENFL